MPADFRRNAQRWHAWVGEMRRNIGDLYGAEPELCVVMLGIPYVTFLTRLNTIEAECRRYLPTEADEQATL